VLLWRRRIMVCRKDWPWYVISFIVSIKISTWLTKIRNIGVSSSRHGRSSGAWARNPCFVRLRSCITDSPTLTILGMDSINIYTNR
jgi:hypothetical protein